MRVFICSPYRGDVRRHRAIARLFCRFVTGLGYRPFAPHLLYTQFLDDEDPDQRMTGIRMALAELADCNLVYVLHLYDKPSEGMQGEIAQAARLNIPVVHFEHTPLGFELADGR